MKIRISAIVLFCLATICVVERASATMLIEVEVVDAYRINISLSGAVIGPTPDIAAGTIYVDTPVPGSVTSYSSSITGTAMLGPFPIFSAFSGFTNPPYDGTLQLRTSLNGTQPLSIGDALSGSASIAFSTPHGMTQNMFDDDGVPVYWGRGTLQGFARSIVKAARTTIPSAWTGKPIPEQVPDSTDGFPIGIGKINVALWLNDSIDQATLTIDDRFNQISSPRLNCAAAGQEGPQIWQEAGTFTQTLRGKQWSFGRDELLANDALESCGVAINTIASLRAAAQQRLIYLEYDRDGLRHRAQLWAKDLLPLEVEVFASLDQAVDPQIPDSSKNKTRVLFKATETRSTLNEIHYMFADRLIYSQVERLELFCAAAGQAGVPIAELTARSSESNTALRQSDLRPASADGPCGVEVNNIASLVEAWLQGRLYVQVQKTSGKVLRGQVPHP